MQEVFLPNLIGSYRAISLLLVLGLIGAIVCWLAFKRKDFPVRPVAQLMGGLFAFVGIIGGIMVTMTMTQTPSMVIAENYLIMGNDTISEAAVKDAYIESVGSVNRIGQSETNDVGILVLSDGRTKAFGDDQYDVKGLITAIRKMKESQPQ